MRERKLSSSSIKTYLQCMLKYYYQYEDKKPRGGKSAALAFGIAVHEALEDLHTVVKNTGAAPGPETYVKVLDTYMMSASKHGLDNLTLYQEGKDHIMNRLDNVDPEERVLGLELRFELATPNGTPFTGSIDKLVELDEDTVVLIDYKTSKFALPQEEADSDIQLSMYDLAVSMLYPQYKTIVCILDYVRMGEVITHRSSEQRKLFVEFLDAIYKGINETPTDDVKANINMFCGWCDFKGYCPDYQKLVTDPDLVLPRIDELSEEEFVSAWETLDAAKKTVEARYRDLKGEVYERMRTAETVQGPDKEIYRTQTARTSYDSRKVFEVIGPNEFSKVASISKAAVDRYLKDNPEKQEELKEASSFSFSSPYFKTRKVKNENR